MQDVRSDSVMYSVLRQLMCICMIILFTNTAAAVCYSVNKITELTAR